MLDLTKNNPKLLALFAALFLLVSFLLFSIPESKHESHTHEDYLQLIENISKPAFLTGQGQQVSLQLKTLIQNTSIQQIRLYDSSEVLLARIQNSESNGTQNRDGTKTYRREILFTGNLAGVLEIDISSSTDNKWSSSVVWILGISCLLSLVTLGVTAFALQKPWLFQNPRTPLSSGKVKRAEPSISGLGKQNEQKQSHLILFTRIRLNGTTKSVTESSSALTLLSETATNMASLYGMKTASIAPGAIAFRDTVPVTTQSINQALVLTWGIAEMSKELSQTDIDIDVQSFLLESTEIKTSIDKEVAYWIEINEFCQAKASKCGFVSNMLIEDVDGNRFELSEMRGSFSQVMSVAQVVQKLWVKQKESK